MDCLRPVYSQKSECQDCYKCVRQCPVKAIRIVDGSAEVMPDRCVACGRCVGVCTFGAKRVRDDLKRAQSLLARSPRVAVSLAPSWVSEFPGLEPGRMIHALERLGFGLVSETALGAEEVSAAVAQRLSQGAAGLQLSSACPVVVEYVRRYRPELVPSFGEVASPLLAHARLLKREYGAELAVVFVGPCVAKKLEADRNPGLVDVALTFEDLRRWFAEAAVDPATLPARGGFLPRQSGRGALYPLVGGMTTTLEDDPRTAGTTFVSVSGLHATCEALQGLEVRDGERVFVELLACKGGCIHGPRSSRPNAIAGRLRVESYAPRSAEAPRAPGVDTRMETVAEPCRASRFEDEEVRQALWRIGKERPEDELNCSGCGYNTCREFAGALLAGMAEEAMCVSYMRRLAQKKANALVQAAPFGIVVVGPGLRVVDCNERFVRLLGPEDQALHETVPGFSGVLLEKLVPFHELFRRVLEGGQDLERQVVSGARTLCINLFTIEPGRLVGATLQDVTQVETRREEIVQKAQQVIQNTLTTVQDIAFRLGRNAADSELILNSIIEGFGSRAQRDQERRP